MIHLAIIAGLAFALLVLVRRGLIHVDMSLPWLLAILVLGFLSTREDFVAWAARQLGILYPPIAIVFLSLFVLLGLITVLLIGYSSLRQRQLMLVRQLVALDLARQEQALANEATPRKTP